MITQTVTVNASKSENIIIGRRGEYGSEQIVFDLAYLIETYGDGSAELLVKRSVDETAYPVVLTRDGNLATWDVTETDTSYKGHGECELFWYVGEALAKSVIYSIAVLRDIGETTETPPDPYQTWVDDLTALGAETLQNAQDAAQSATDAENAKDAAEEAASILESPTAEATTLDPDEPATASYADGKFSFGIPKGKPGEQGNPGEPGQPGKPGADGFSPTVSTEAITGGTKVTITDKNGEHDFDVMNGIDGFSPTATVTQEDNVTTITITDKDGTTTEDIDLNPVIGAITELSINKADVITDTASGSVASFSDGMDAPIKQMTVNIEPIQDLHGYDSPWPAGGGVNKANVNYTESITGSKTITFSPPLPAGNYIFSFVDADTTSSVVSYQLGVYKDTSASFSYYAVSPSNKKQIVHTTESCSKIVLYSNKAYNESSRFTTVFSGIQFESGETVSPWSPYSNFCPITGYTGAEIAHVGKNLWNEVYPHLGSTIRYTPVYVGDGNVTLSTDNPEVSTNVDNLFLLAGNVSSGASSMTNGVYKDHPRTVAAVDGYVTVAYRNYTGGTPLTSSKTQLEYGTSATEYEAQKGGTTVIAFPNTGNLYDKDAVINSYYLDDTGTLVNSGGWTVSDYIFVESGQSYTFSGFNTGGTAPRSCWYDSEKHFLSAFNIGSTGEYTVTVPDTAKYLRASILVDYKGTTQIEKGTSATAYKAFKYPVFSATLAINEDGTGRLTVNDVEVDMGGLSWDYITNDGTPYYFRATATGRKIDPFNVKTSIFKTNSAAGTRNLQDCSIIGSSSIQYVFVRYDALNNASAFTTAVTGQQLVYELANKPVYDLTAEQVGIIQTLYGNNNIWAATGDISLEHRCDTRLYIEQLTAPTEDDMVADHAISSGTFFMIGNNLYLATAAIASGAQITLGTNATKLSLADALNAINS